MPDVITEPLMSAGEMADWIRFAYGAIYGDDEIGGGPINSFDWVYHPAFDARITVDGLDPAQRAAWMRDEIQTEIEDELDRGWGTMAEEDIQEPSIIVLVDGQAYCWDGNHRIGSRCLGADPYLPAIVGTPKEARVQRPSPVNHADEFALTDRAA